MSADLAKKPIELHQVRPPSGDEYQKLTGFGMALLVLERLGDLAKKLNELIAAVNELRRASDDGR